MGQDIQEEWFHTPRHAEPVPGEEYDVASVYYTITKLSQKRPNLKAQPHTFVAATTWYEVALQMMIAAWWRNLKLWALGERRCRAVER